MSEASRVAVGCVTDVGWSRKLQGMCGIGWLVLKSSWMVQQWWRGKRGAIDSRVEGLRVGSMRSSEEWGVRWEVSCWELQGPLIVQEKGAEMVWGWAKWMVTSLLLGSCHRKSEISNLACWPDPAYCLFLKHRHSHSFVLHPFVYTLSRLLCAVVRLSNCTRDDPTNPKIFISWLLLEKKIADFWFRRVCLHIQPASKNHLQDVKTNDWTPPSVFLVHWVWGL